MDIFFHAADVLGREPIVHSTANECMFVIACRQIRWRSAFKAWAIIAPLPSM